MKQPYCEHGVSVAVDPDVFGPGVTRWQHGNNPEHVRMVTLAERREWEAQGYGSGVNEIYRWVERIHEYERREVPHDR